MSIWVEDGLDCFNVYIDEKLITEQGADALQAILRNTVTGWQRLDESFVMRTLKAVTG
ncbi:hypothetical protein [Streptomyces sp. NPDC059786]|uniref:hypothetical protein n=1 Tax=Streptomyces sp. NPDC059786 TaxID=3346946 RepID=UPI003665CE77